MKKVCKKYMDKQVTDFFRNDMSDLYSALTKFEVYECKLLNNGTQFEYYHISYNSKFKTIMSKSDLNEYFYTEREWRKVKLERLNLYESGMQKR